MKHIDNYSVLLVRDNEFNDFTCMAILQIASLENLRHSIAIIFDEWCYDDSEENHKLLDNIADSLYRDCEYIDDFHYFRLECVAYFE